jgi:hypothetical protein
MDMQTRVPTHNGFYVLRPAPLYREVGEGSGVRSTRVSDLIARPLERGEHHVSHQGLAGQSDNIYRPRQTAHQIHCL